MPDATSSVCARSHLTRTQLAIHTLPVITNTSHMHSKPSATCHYSQNFKRREALEHALRKCRDLVAGENPDTHTHTHTQRVRVARWLPHTRTCTVHLTRPLYCMWQWFVACSLQINVHAFVVQQTALELPTCTHIQSVLTTWLFALWKIDVYDAANHTQRCKHMHLCTYMYT